MYRIRATTLAAALVLLAGACSEAPTEPQHAAPAAAAQNGTIRIGDGECLGDDCNIPPDDGNGGTLGSGTKSGDGGS